MLSTNQQLRQMMNDIVQMFIDSKAGFCFSAFLLFLPLSLVWQIKLQTYFFKQRKLKYKRK
jgi:hypothetical protein